MVGYLQKKSITLTIWVGYLQKKKSTTPTLGSDTYRKKIYYTDYLGWIPDEGIAVMYPHKARDDIAMAGARGDRDLAQRVEKTQKTHIDTHELTEGIISCMRSEP